MEEFYKVVDTINNVFIYLFSAAFTLQLLFVLLFFLPAKKYKKAKKQHKFGIIIPARNESAVIEDTIRTILTNQTYPKELYDIFVVADNCTDNTAELARRAGAKAVFEHFDDDPKHKRASYALEYGFQHILAEYDEYDAFIKFDADNIPNPEYIEKMNDAFDSGVEIARPYSNSKNLVANTSTKISGLYYIRNSRFTCQVRSALHLNQMLTGAGLMVSADIIREIDGWDCMSISDDTQFAMKRILEGRKTAYVSEAVCYEDQPLTLGEAFNRNKRIGKGIFKIFFADALVALAQFFLPFRLRKTKKEKEEGKKIVWCLPFKFTYLDMFLELLFIPMAFVAVFWFPAFYIFDIVYKACLGNIEGVIIVLKNLAFILVVFFYIPFVLQGLLCVALDHKKMNIESPKQVIGACFVLPVYMIVYCLSIAFGILSKPKWKAVTRSSASSADVVASTNVHIATEFVDVTSNASDEDSETLSVDDVASDEHTPDDTK